ncbi:hypothetical protein NUU61_006642 [Penicillium alfredii]|uniref:Arrestin-like N-terminal domain-containing protein n=1 Tax=Penicillium alfredii TaxID=1506179 RepID=A0A9W9K4G2_9EURO|nr:uncharacterized protein NUU61_006642 [Penicillium alfredii]KAJ5091772.1 hypothetical protein NUU61_006642 [Penicillium alfredii]
MPPTSLESSPKLKIVLETSNHFTPGDIIRGHVLRQSPIVDPNASVSLRLCARTRSYTAVGGMGRQEFASTFKLLDSLREVLEIHQGPIHIPPNSTDNNHGRWPFAITLPKHPDLASLKKDNEDEKTFLPFEEIASQDLPPSLSVKTGRTSPYTEAFVEYYLEATMRCTGSQKHTLGSRRNHRELQAILPLQISPNLPSISSTNCSTQHRSEPKQRLVSQRLVLGVDSRLGIGQHLRKMIKSSQVPEYSFSLQLDFATLLQIGNPNPIPLQLRANTIWADTSDILQPILPTILVKQFNLTLLSNALCTSKRFKNMRVSGLEGFSVKSTSILADYTSTLGPKPVSYANGTSPKAQSNIPLMVPQDDPTPLDLGIALGIRSPKSSAETNAYPTFTTCNIQATHAIEWNITLSIAGETMKYQGQQPVTVMGPSNKA